MTKTQVLDLYFADARSRMIDLAAFLDRVDEADGQADFRLAAFRAALQHLLSDQPGRAKAALMALSDPTSEPVPHATTKGAMGAWAGENG